MPMLGAAHLAASAEALVAPPGTGSPGGHAATAAGPEPPPSSLLIAQPVRCQPVHSVGNVSMGITDLMLAAPPWLHRLCSA